MAAYAKLPLLSKGPAQPDKPSSLKVGLYMVAWIVSSNITILFNKWLLDTAGFKYPILLVTWHLIFATVVTQILAHTTSYLDSRHDLPNNWDFFLTTVLPIGIVSSGSLVASNFVYLYLSVAVIQMLKAASPVSVLLVSWLFGVVNPTMEKILNILVIAVGVAVASAGTVEFSAIGFFFQMGGLAFEAVRVVMTQVMLNGEGLKMDAMVGLYYYAPVVAVLNLLVAFVIEVPHFDIEDFNRVGFPMLFLNAAVAFTLNFTSMVLIGKTSGLVMSLSGIFKNILLVICSVLIWHVTITPIQLFGYSVTLCALVYYSLGREKLREGYEASLNWVSGVATNKGVSFRTRKGVWIALGPDCDYVFLTGYGPEAQGQYLRGKVSLFVPEKQHVQTVQLKFTSRMWLGDHAAPTEATTKWQHKEQTILTWSPFEITDQTGKPVPNGKQYDLSFETFIRGDQEETFKGCNRCSITYLLEASTQPQDVRSFVPIRIIRTPAFSSYELMDPSSVHGKWSTKAEYNVSVRHRAIALGGLIPIDAQIHASSKIVKARFYLREVHTVDDVYEGQRVVTEWPLDVKKESELQSWQQCLHLPLAVRSCSPDVKMHGVGISHTLHFEVTLVTDGVTSEEEVSMPIYLFISPELPVNGWGVFVHNKDITSKEVKDSLAEGIRIPPRYCDVDLGLDGYGLPVGTPPPAYSEC
ncbi:hypothetical protein NW752_002372 [Fusarium irregulare]|nr:hypothetical protein NW752_002372 [Fusarium irregulare]